MDTKKAFMEKHLFETQDILCDVGHNTLKTRFGNASLIKPAFLLGLGNAVFCFCRAVPFSLSNTGGNHE
jgi:hypothetical protein